MVNHRTEYSDEEALFRSYPYALYFVQSPSAASHANYDLHSDQEPTRLALSRYSSSRGSNNSFLQDQSKKKLNSAGDDHVPENAGKGGGNVKSGLILRRSRRRRRRRSMIMIMGIRGTEGGLISISRSGIRIRVGG
ncbi:UNVERIFIED_CONTAM: hypothetical protein Slati_0330400 [Sesamum latifolium]|uniref:Uncharacterized protein n=1 Tax=Sesamum latifolium TaxID=2727402 RepID=A0AAW2YEV3_9LAMI